MGVVVLDLLDLGIHPPQPAPAGFGGKVVRVHVDRDHLGQVIVQRQIKREGFLIVRESRRALQVANVLGQDRLTVFEQTECALEFTAKRSSGPACSKPAGSLTGTGA